MDKERLIAQMKSCAVLLYQNEREVAENEVRKLLPEINEVLQRKAVMPEYEITIVSLTEQFLGAFQRHDTLALADLLGNDLPQVVD